MGENGTRPDYRQLSTWVHWHVTGLGTDSRCERNGGPLRDVAGKKSRNMANAYTTAEIAIIHAFQARYGHSAHSVATVVPEGPASSATVAELDATVASGRQAADNARALAVDRADHVVRAGLSLAEELEAARVVIRRGLARRTWRQLGQLGHVDADGSEGSDPIVVDIEL